MSFDIFKLPTGVEKTYGKNLYILGTSNTGIPYEPILIKNKNQLTKEFGTEGSLIRAWHEANSTIQDINIFLVKVNGEVSTCSFKDIHGNVITFTTTKADPIYNKIKITWTREYLEIENPNELGGQMYRFQYQDYPTIENLMMEINHMCIKNQIVFHLSTKTPEAEFIDFAIQNDIDKKLDKPTHFDGGYSDVDISKNKLHSNLEIAYNILEGEPIDVIIPAEAYFDDVYDDAYFNKNRGFGIAFYTADRDYLNLPHKKYINRKATFHGQLIDFCKLQLNSGIITHGVLAFNPMETIEDILKEQAYITKVATATCFKDRFDLVEGIEGSRTDNGKFISIVLGELEYDHSNGHYYNNGYVAYGAMIASKLDKFSLTNEIVPNIKSIRYNLSSKESNMLSRMGIVTFRKSLLKKSIVVSNAVTAAMENSPYHFMSNMRMSQVVMSYFKETLEYFRGQNIHVLKASKSIEKALDQLIADLKKEKALRDIKYNLRFFQQGYATLELEIKPLYTLEYIKASGNFKI